MKLPDRDIGEFAQEVADRCLVSQNERRDQYAKWRQYFLDGRADGTTAKYNRCYAHIDRLTSYLFSPAEVRFLIQYDHSQGEMWQAMADTGSRYLNREFHRCGVDLKFSEALEWAEIKGSTFLKMQWGHDGLDPWIIQPEFMGVYREDITGLSRQEAIVQRSFLTIEQFRRIVSGKHNAADLIAKVEKHRSLKSAADEVEENYLHQIVFGALHPVALPGGGGSTSSGLVSVPTQLSPILSPEIMAGLIEFYEMYVIDDDREDYTTLRWVAADIVVDGQFTRENLFLKGEHPYTQICANPSPGYFWGISELAELAPLQDMLNERIDSLNRLFKLRANPPTAFSGYSGITEQKYQSLMTPGGWISEQNPNAKAQAMAPEIPPEMFTSINEVIGFFDDVGGFESITKGQGEAGVRSGSHADTLVRTASPRLRDRTLLIERQCGDVGELCFKLLQAKVADLFTARTKDKQEHEFVLDDLPEDYRVTIDSHSGSPAFQADTRNLVAFLARVNAIGPEEALLLLNPPHADMLMQKARERAEAQAQFIAEHPEAIKGAGGKKR